MGFLEIGRIIKPHGLKGRLKVLSYLESDDLSAFSDRLLIKLADDKTAFYSLKSLKIGGRCCYLEIEGIESIEQAEPLVGCTVLVHVDKLAPLPEGEYYWQELIGLEVITEEGRSLGKLERIFPTGSNDVYVCGRGEKEILLPAIAEVVRKIDLEKGMVVVRLLEGL